MIRPFALAASILGALLAAPAHAQFSEVQPASLSLELAEGETAVRNVSFTFFPLCIRAYELVVVASDPTAIVTNLSGQQTNGCGGDTSSFSVQFTGAGVVQSFDLQFVDPELSGAVASIPVTVFIGERPDVVSEGERGPLLACFYECLPAPTLGGAAPSAWREMSALMITNVADEAASGVLAYFDGNQSLVAASRLALGANDVDEVNICASLREGGVTPPQAGLAFLAMSSDAQGTYAWVKDFAGRFRFDRPEPSRGIWAGVGKTECRVVPSTVKSAQRLIRRVESEAPPLVVPVLIDDTAD